MNKILSKLLTAKYFIGIFFVGIIFLVGGIVLFNTKEIATASADATITNIEQTDYDAELNEYSYTVSLTYKDKDGNEHNVSTDVYDSSWKNGSVITIKYDPENPENISYGNVSNKTLSYILMGVGAACVVVSVVKFVMTVNTSTDENKKANK